MTPNDESNSGKSQKLLKSKLSLRNAFHWTQTKRVLERVQEALPKDLALALFYSASAESKEIWKEVYEQDVLTVGKAARGGNLSLRRLFKGKMGSLNLMQFRPSKITSMADETKTPLLNFLDQVGRDLEKLDHKSEKITYLLKVATLVVSTASGIGIGLRVATFGLAPNKFGKRPWIPSLGLVLVSSALAKYLSHALGHLESESEDRQLAEFLKANLEILAFGGSLGVLEVPDFIKNPSQDSTLQAVQQLVQELMEPATPNDLKLKRMLPVQTSGE